MKKKETNFRGIVDYKRKERTSIDINYLRQEAENPKNENRVNEGGLECSSLITIRVM